MRPPPPGLAQPTVPTGPADRPYDRLAELPRELWLPALVASVGNAEARLRDTRRWQQALEAGTLPPPQADFGDAEALAPLRLAVAELGLPGLSRGVPALAEQVLRTLLWHLDRIVDHQPRLDRTAAIARAAADFRAEWQLESSGWDERFVLLDSLGDPSRLSWDQLRGHLNSRPWRQAQQAAAWLEKLPQLAALIRRLGRAERQTAAPAPAVEPRPDARAVTGLRAVETRLPDAPGELTGVQLTGRVDRMLASEAVMLRHPVLCRLWRARQAEARLLGWQSEAVLTDWRHDPAAPPRSAATPPEPESLGRGPFILCLDTSGSMRGAPENIARAIVIAAMRAAHAERRGCVLIAFGGPGEVIERELDLSPGGLQALMDLMGQAFDGGTDVQTPIERAVERVHQARWRQADLLIVTDGEFGCMPATLARLDQARERFGLRVQGVLAGDRETMGLLDACDDIHWVRDWRRYTDDPAAVTEASPVHSRSLTALYFPNALSGRAARHHKIPT
ncbi:MAG: hypothetical protein QG612_2129 [Pseudomonadota bacterium]|nr:hypothetical protein [Pseudomonadota bacterium]